MDDLLVIWLKVVKPTLCLNGVLAGEIVLISPIFFFKIKKKKLIQTEMMFATKEINGITNSSTKQKYCYKNN